MPYKDKNAQRKYQKEWMSKRRKEYFDNKKCAWCGSADELVLHHVDPKKKESHRIWSWKKQKIQEETQKCIVVCRTCHIEYHAEKLRTFNHGIANTYKSKGCRCDACRSAQHKTKHRQAPAIRKEKP